MLTDFQKFFTDRFTSKYATKSSLTMGFWVTVYKTVCSMLPDRCLSVCPICNVGVLWPNGWMDQDKTWCEGRPRPGPHCVRWGARFPPPKGHSPSQFSTHICCGQMAWWIKMPLVMEVGLNPSDIVLDGDLAPLPKRRQSPPIFGPCLLWPHGCMDQDATLY